MIVTCTSAHPQQRSLPATTRAPLQIIMMAFRLTMLSAVTSAWAWPAGLKLATFDGNKTTTHTFVDSERLPTRDV